MSAKYLFSIFWAAHCRWRTRGTVFPHNLTMARCAGVLVAEEDFALFVVGCIALVHVWDWFQTESGDVDTGLCASVDITPWSLYDIRWSVCQKAKLLCCFATTEACWSYSECRHPWMKVGGQWKCLTLVYKAKLCEYTWTWHYNLLWFQSFVPDPQNGLIEMNGKSCRFTLPPDIIWM